jgi:hypothetical protein
MKDKTLKLAAMMAVPMALLALSSCSSTSTADSLRGGVVVDSVTATATVVSINADDRTVVLRRGDGNDTTYTCGPEVRNFNQIAVGDQVNATVAEELALILVKGGMAPVMAQTTAVIRAPLGAKPGGKVLDTVSFTARVVALDATQRSVTLQMADGRSKTVKVAPDINLANVSPGDDVGVRLTQAVMITVAKP